MPQDYRIEFDIPDDENRPNEDIPNPPIRTPADNFAEAIRRANIRIDNWNVEAPQFIVNDWNVTPIGVEEDIPEDEIWYGDDPVDPEPEEEAELPANANVRTVPRPIGNYFKFLTVNGSRITSDRQLKTGDSIHFAWWNMTSSAAKVAGFKTLREWAEQNNVKLGAMGFEQYFAYYRAPFSFYISVVAEDGSYLMPHPEAVLTQDNCWSCGETGNVFPTEACRHCGNRQHCPGCYAIINEWSTRSANAGYCCDNCGSVCDDCGDTWRSDRYAVCPNCNVLVSCNYCGEHHAEDDVEYIEALDQYYCRTCIGNICRGCGNAYDEYQIIDGFCIACTNAHVNEEYDAHELVDNFEIPAIPGRENILLCGVEIEGASGPRGAGSRAGNYIAYALNEAGLARYNEMLGYHHGDPNDTVYKVHVERDASVDWEVVIGPINMAKNNDVEILEKAVKIIRKNISDEIAKLDMRAGLHIHVGAAKVPLEGAYNLHRLYMYMEDFFYRVGAAKWPHHRAILKSRGHPQKNPDMIGKLNFVQNMGENRYYGLSFSNYINTYFARCGCGARQYGMFQDCTCDLGKCTFEFRVFNTTANTTKLHAYLALCQALVAKATSMPEITDNEFPALDFIDKKLEDFSAAQLKKYARAYEECIEFVNNQLPLTDKERQSIYYCVMNCEISKVVTNAAVLLDRREII